jgi:hypothetical protein
LTEAIKAQAIELAVVRGKSGWDLLARSRRGSPPT